MEDNPEKWGSPDVGQKKQGASESIYTATLTGYIESIPSL